MLKTQLACCQLLVKKSHIDGYGVFADQDILPNSVIEESYAREVDPKDGYLLNYFFGYQKKAIVALGYGSIYNHSDHPNADYEYDPLLSLIVFRAKKKIKKGEEIYISYGPNWFSSRGLRNQKPFFWWKWRAMTFLILRFSVVFAIILLLPHLK